MSSENKTPNLGLNQWESNEYPKRQDFVDDNEKIDMAIKNLQDNLGNSVKINESEPKSYNEKTVWMKIVSSDNFEFGSGVDIGNAKTSSTPPGENSDYWFEPIK